MTPRRRTAGLVPVEAAPLAVGTTASAICASGDLADEVAVRVVLAGGWVLGRWSLTVWAGPADVVLGVAAEVNAATAAA